MTKITKQDEIIIEQGPDTFIMPGKPFVCKECGEWYRIEVNKEANKFEEYRCLDCNNLLYGP